MPSKGRLTGAEPSYGWTRTGGKVHLRDPDEPEYTYCGARVSPHEAEPDPFGCCKTCLYRWSAAGRAALEDDRG